MHMNGDKNCQYLCDITKDGVIVGPLGEGEGRGGGGVLKKNLLYIIYYF